MMASPPDEQAVETVRLGPVIWCWMENWQAATLPMYLVSSFGSADLPRWSIFCCVLLRIFMPCSAVAMTMPVRSEPVSAACVTACSAAA